ncbi:hypothetical protein DFH06DRAFT_1308864 [Mycena polygramma]|nr:hypothetical protein DFH06DRAFT_1308864 [Mycena polygramma]
MNRHPGPSRGAAAHPTGQNQYPNLYGEGAPQGDPFHVPAPIGGPVFHDARSLGHGPPPNTPRALRAASLDPPHAFPHGSALSRARTASQPVYDPALMTTPTPSRYQIPPRPRAAAHSQLAIPEERTQTEQLLDMMQLLLNGQAELTQRISNVESELYQLRQPSVPDRGIAAQRGGRITRSKRATSGHLRPRVTTPTSDGSDLDSTQPASTTDASDDDDGLTIDALELSKPEKRAIQSFVTKKFRQVCNVPGRHWPDPTLLRENTITHEVYPTPVFAVTVADPQNQRLFHQVAEQAFADLQNPNCWPETLRKRTPSPTWDLAYIFTCAKESFRNLKRPWQEVQKIEAAIKGDTNRQTNRRLKRRMRKSEKLTKIVYAFAAKHGLDSGFLVDLLHEQFLSDEGSGPEDDSEETNEAWKVRLSSAAGLPLDPGAQKNIKILEILAPAWRSESYTRLIHAMQEFGVDDSSTAEESNAIYHRVGMGRASGRIPRYSPYNFGISPEWWRENSNRPANKKLLKDWYQYPEPDGCGLTVERDAVGSIVAAHFTPVNN